MSQTKAQLLDGSVVSVSFGAGSAAAPSINYSADSTTGIYFPGSGQLAISTGGTVRVYVDGSGNLGIGITPSAWVDDKALQIGYGAISSGYEYGISTTANAFRSTTNTWKYLNGQAAFRSNINNGGFQWLTAPSGTAGNSITFTQGMALDANGRLLIGPSGTASYQLQLTTDSAGKPSTNTWTIVSDERIKEDIELADLDLCYEAVKSIPLKRYKWRDEVYTEKQVTDRRKIGWIAQDVEAVFPKAVNTHEFKYNQVYAETVIPAIKEELNKKGQVITAAQPEQIERKLVSEDVITDCKDLNADQIYAAMYGALQKLINKVETLEAEVAALKGK